MGSDSKNECLPWSISSIQSYVCFSKMLLFFYAFGCDATTSIKFTSSYTKPRERWFHFTCIREQQLKRFKFELLHYWCKISRRSTILLAWTAFSCFCAKLHVKRSVWGDLPVGFWARKKRAIWMMMHLTDYE